MNRLLPVLCLLIIATSSCALVGGSVSQKELAAEYVAVGDAWADMGKYDKAIGWYEKASQRKEFKNVTRYALGRMYALSGKWEEAVPRFKVLYEEEPDNYLVSQAYAYSLVMIGDTEKAFPIYEKNWKDNSSDPTANRNYAEILFLAGRYEDTLDQIAILREDFSETDVFKGLDELEKKTVDAQKIEIEGEETEYTYEEIKDSAFTRDGL